MSNDASLVLEALLLGHGDSAPLSGLDFSQLGSDTTGELLRQAARALAAGPVDGAAAETGLPRLLDLGIHRLREELAHLPKTDPHRYEALREAARAVRNGDLNGRGEGARRLLWPVFFPEGARLLDGRDEAIRALRTRRIVHLDTHAEKPIEDPITELIFTSNVLLTVPHTREEIEGLDYPEETKARIRAAFDEPQLYYYDHPIHIGTPRENNEAVYGLCGLDRAVAWEKEHGTADGDARLTVVLSLSVTHEGLHDVGREYLAEELGRAGGFEHLDVYLFTEVECRRAVEEALTPNLPAGTVEDVHAVFGVDGEYGRHYSFLKAIAAYWTVFVDPRIRGTFKIDLDQVFPQDELAEQTGRSAFGHFRTPLWGARGVDSEGTSVRLGMIAGALVNEKDIGAGVFTPDVPFPKEIPTGDAAVFFSKLPMAVSTRAEMMTRYGETDGQSPIDGRKRCIQRVHVTGGTNGILVEDLIRYRPFTPTFIGRAEDQAYLLSVLGKEVEGQQLRYVHEPGLIMRHDKEAFAGESMAAARAGRFVGDLVRTFYFSRYTESLPWGHAETKTRTDPFTGCFITRTPVTVITLRLLLHAAALVSEGDTAEARSVLEIADRKLTPLFAADSAADVAAAFRRERGAWNAFYDALAAAREQQSGARTGIPSVMDTARLDV